ncbi:class I SAM-dependent methyltransferase [Candidatus Woesearchaeota archaeon]|nr:class I SAM-dependent methyltransferase [Candidatus Woesearchaeota archaeon]
MLNLEDYLRGEGIVPRSNKECDYLEEQILGKKLKHKLDEMANNAIQDSSDEKRLEVRSFQYFAGIYKFIDCLNYDELMKIIPFIMDNGIRNKKRVLDVGCGYGLKTVFYALNSDAEVFGIDILHSALDETNRRAEKHVVGVRTLLGNFLNLELSGFDSVISTNMIDEFMVHQNDEVDLNLKLAKFYSLLSNNGSLVINCNPCFVDESKDTIEYAVLSNGFNGVRIELIPYFVGSEERINLGLVAYKTG